MINSTTFLLPPTAIPTSQWHLLLNKTVVQQSFNETEKTADHNGDTTADGQDPRGDKKPAAVAVTPKEKGPTNQLKVLLMNQQHGVSGGTLLGQLTDWSDWSHMGGEITSELQVNFA